jgi:hypothetical protein
MFYMVDRSALSTVYAEVENAQCEQIAGANYSRILLTEEQAERLSGRGVKLAPVGENCFVC